jgi:hypothetical protein
VRTIRSRCLLASNAGKNTKIEIREIGGDIFRATGESQCK